MAEIDRLIAELAKENESLKKLIEENARLNETIFEKTGKERVEELIRKTDERNSILKKAIDAINADLGTTINLDNITESLSSLQDSIKESKREVDDLRTAHNDFTSEARKELRSYEKELRKLQEELATTTDPTRQAELNNLIQACTDQIQDLTSEIETANRELKDAEDTLTQQEKAYKLLHESASEFYAAANEEQKELNKRQLEGTTGLDDWGEKWEQRTRAIRKGGKEIADGAKKIYDSITKTLEPWSKANHEAMAYAKNMGMSQKTADAYLQKTVSWAAKNNIGILFNKSTDELIKMQGKYSEVLGRNVQLTSEQKKDMLAMETFLGEDGMMDIANNLENFGMGMSDSADFVKKTMDSATKSGIAASKLTKTIRENIKMAQDYTFKDGLKGLESMAKKAIQLKTDMSLINSFAEKTSTVEGAIQTGAQLQVLGGSYALGSDPLSMMYESLNDVEGLFDRAVNMAKGKVQYNSQTGNFEMGAMDRYMMKQAATAMGVDPSKMMDVAFRQASLDKIEGQAKMNANIAGDEDMMELVKNLATWDKGNAVVNIDGKDKKVSELTSADKEKLEAMQKTDSQNLQDMAISLRSMNDILSGTQKEINNEQANTTQGIANTLNEMLRNNTDMLDNVAKIGAWFNIITGAAGVLGGILGVANGIWRTIIGMGNLVGGGGFDRMGRGRMRGLGRNRGLIGRTKQIFRVGRSHGMKGLMRMGRTAIGRGVGGFGRAATGTLGRTATSAVGRTASSTVGRAALSGAGKVLTGVGGAVLGGVAGAGVSLVTDIVTGDFKKDTGASVGRAVGTGVGAAIGSIFGPVGTMVGGWLGGLVAGGIQDAQKKNRAKIRKDIANELSSTMPSVAKLFEGENALEGNYNKSQLNELKKALEDGKISEGELSKSTIRKARANGDLKRMYDQGIGVEIALAKGGIINSDTGAKRYDNGGPLTGPSHAEGGMPILGSNVVVEGGEYVINKKATEDNLPLLNEINSGNIKMTAKEPLGKQMKVHNGKRSEGAEMPHNSKIDIAPVSVNLSGTIKLDLGSNKQIDISDDLINNPVFVQKITEMISKEINIKTNGAYHKKKFLQKFI